MDAREFEWESQLRFYWEQAPDELIVRQCTGQFGYGYEYMGLNGRLVITPLTDRIYLTITQVWSLNQCFYELQFLFRYWECKLYILGLHYPAVSRPQFNMTSWTSYERLKYVKFRSFVDRVVTPGYDLRFTDNEQRQY